MQPEEFLRKQMLERINTHRRLRNVSRVIKAHWQDRCVILWKTSCRRGEDAVREAIRQMTLEVPKDAQKKTLP